MANEILDGLTPIPLSFLAVGIICITIGIGLLWGLTCALVFFGICCIGLFIVITFGLALTDDEEEKEGE